MQRNLDELRHRCAESTFIQTQLNFALRATAAENVSILMLSQTGEELIFTASVGRKSDLYVGNGNLEHALRVKMSGELGLNPIAVLYGKPMWMEKSDPRHNPSIDEAVGTNTRSLYTIPLAVNEQTVGTLSTINLHVGELDGTSDKLLPEDSTALHAVAEAVACWLNRQWEDLGRDQEAMQTSQ